MADAGIGLPLDYEIVGSINITEVRPLSNLQNDEVGLVFESQDVPNGNDTVIRIACSGEVSFVSLLGLSADFRVRMTSYTSLSNMNSSTGGTMLFDMTGPLSANKTSSHNKTFVKLDAPVTSGFYTLLLRNFSGTTNPVSFWRLLMGTWVEPEVNIEVMAQASIDDRSARRYSPTGKRNFTRYGIHPTFTGKWPWLSEIEYKSQIRPMMLKYGASIPVLFCLDYEDTDWGEDSLYYGDLEREQAIVLDDAQLYSYQFSIVDIAPVDLTA